MTGSLALPRSQTQSASTALPLSLYICSWTGGSYIMCPMPESSYVSALLCPASGVADAYTYTSTLRCIGLSQATTRHWQAYTWHVWTTFARFCTFQPADGGFLGFELCIRYNVNACRLRTTPTGTLDSNVHEHTSPRMKYCTIGPTLTISHLAQVAFLPNLSTTVVEPPCQGP